MEKLSPPRQVVGLAKQIAASWLTPSSNYIVVAAPLTNGEDLLKLLVSEQLWEDVGLNRNRLAIAFFRSGQIVDPENFTRSVISQWGVDCQKLSGLSDTYEILSLAIEAVHEQGRLPILLIGGFHKAIERLSWDVGAALRNLEHSYGLRTVVELPIKLSTLRNRWDIFKPEVPFLASEFGQGHSTRVVGSYDEDETKNIARSFGVTLHTEEIIYKLTGGFQALVSWAARESLSCAEISDLINIINQEARDICQRFLKWIDSPKETMFKRLMAGQNTYPGSGIELSSHEWGQLLIDSTGNFSSQILLEACRQELTFLGKSLKVEKDKPGMEANASSSLLTLQAAMNAGNTDVSTKAIFNPEVVAVFATHWGTKHGGINAFNLDFCIRLSAALGYQLKLVCFVPTRECISESLDTCNVIALRDSGDNDFSDFDASTAASLLQEMGKVIAVIGHDAKTGKIANSVGNAIKGAKKINFCHMAYDNYYALTATSEQSLKKGLAQRGIFVDSDYIFAVGPKLKKYVADQLRGASVNINVFEYIPPLLNENPVGTPRHTPKITFIGRIEPDKDPIKQSKLAVTAIGRAIRAAGDKLKDVSVQIIGADSTEDEAEIKGQINQEAGRLVASAYLGFVESRREVIDYIRDSSLLLMPSFHEGFGLVAWEAISLGIPVIISKNSGVYETLMNFGLAEKVGSIKVTGGGSISDSSAETDIENLADLIKERLEYQRQYHAESAELIENLKLRNIDKSVIKFADFIGKIGRDYLS